MFDKLDANIIRVLGGNDLLRYVRSRKRRKSATPKMRVTTSERELAVTEKNCQGLRKALGNFGLSTDQTNTALKSVCKAGIEISDHRKRRPHMTRPLTKFVPKRMVYVACPISQGDVIQNYRNAFDVAAELMRTTYIAPYCPAKIGLALCHSFTHDEWMDHDLSILALCSAMVWLPGPSTGRDIELAYARDNHIPCFEWPVSRQEFYSWVSCNDAFLPRRPFNREVYFGPDGI